MQLLPGMYTRARAARHPLHPILVGFPFALYAATVATLIAHVGTGDASWYRAAVWANLTGLAMAVFASIPGLVDLANLPAFSTARAVGVRHAACNVAALLLFASSGAVLYGNWAGGHSLTDALPLSLASAGLMATAAAGWYGWSLVQTHPAGVAATTYPGPRLRSRHDLNQLVPPPAAYRRASAQTSLSRQ